MLVVHKHGDSVGFFENGVMVKEVAVGRKPHEVVLSPDGRLAYVTNYGVDRYDESVPGGTTISIVDTRQRAVVGEIPLGEHRRPHGIARGRSGRLYITTDYPAALLVIDPTARKVMRSLDVRDKLPHMVEVLPNESKAYTANAGSGSVTVLKLQGDAAPRIIPVGGVPMGFALTRDARRLFVGTRGGNEVIEVDTARDEIVRRVSVTGEPARLRLTPKEDRLLVSLIRSNELAVLETAGLKEIHRAPAGLHAEGLGVSLDGSKGYITAQDDHQIVEFALDNYRVLRRIPTGKRPDPMVFLPGTGR